MKLVNHFMTHFSDDEQNEIYISWIQINFFNKAYVFSKRTYKNGKRIGK